MRTSLGYRSRPAAKLLDSSRRREPKREESAPRSKAMASVSCLATARRCSDEERFPGSRVEFSGKCVVEN